MNNNNKIITRRDRHEPSRVLKKQCVLQSIAIVDNIFARIVVELIVVSIVPFETVATLCNTTSAREQKTHFSGEVEMNAIKMLAIVLIVAGGLGLLYGGFTYTKDTHETKIGPIVLAVKDTQTVNIPIWAGVGSIVAGMILLFARK